MDNPSKPTPRGDATRDALIEAATLIFARDRFGSANLREIAGLAKVNPALIGYHFRNKEGLYLAVFERMVGQLKEIAVPWFASMRQALAGDAPREACLELILQFLDRMLVHTLQENPAWGELIVCELQTPTSAFQCLFQGMMGPAVDALTGLLERLRPQDPPQRRRLLAASIITQVAVIRISRSPILRLMGWDAIGPAEREAMRAMIRRNTTLIVLGD
jgi:TetR/AcrR family transcriptional regulator, regulator of cefoperazone and chloramphenicol sensitivity